MKIISFSVTNYRSITTAHKIKLGQFTVLIGKNNEGKSNLLKALNLAMNIMSIYAEDPRYLVQVLRRRYDPIYKWDRDFPISLQGVQRVKPTTLDMEFILDEDELKELKRITGIRMANIVPVRITITHDRINIDIPKRGSSSFKDHAQEIIQFVCSKINLTYIPAIRTEQDAMKVINRLISRELRDAEQEPEYAEALMKVQQLRQQVLDNIATRITDPLTLFLPSIKSVSIQLNDNEHGRMVNHDVVVSIDDGTSTNIRFKGDGVKSLTTLALLNIRNDQRRASVITIEEPESHLHPGAMHSIFDTITTLSEDNQIIITTHSPMFVNRKNIASNVIVNAGKATAAKSIRDIRDILGVVVSDNLTNASHILLVEGESDKVILEKLLPELSESIKKALKNKSLVVDSMSGCGNINYTLKLHREIQCQYHVLLDNDTPGKQAYERAADLRYLSLKEVTFTTCRGMSESELEDAIKLEIYSQAILDEFGVNLNTPDFRGRAKWSERVKACFFAQGKTWDKNIEKRVKEIVAHSIPRDPNTALIKAKRSWLDALKASLEALLE